MYQTQLENRLDDLKRRELEAQREMDKVEAAMRRLKAQLLSLKAERDMLESLKPVVIA